MITHWKKYIFSFHPWDTSALISSAPTSTRKSSSTIILSTLPNNITPAVMFKYMHSISLGEKIENYRQGQKVAHKIFLAEDSKKALWIFWLRDTHWLHQTLLASIASVQFYFQRRTSSAKDFSRFGHHKGQLTSSVLLWVACLRRLGGNTGEIDSCPKLPWSYNSFQIYIIFHLMLSVSVVSFFLPPHRFSQLSHWQASLFLMVARA